jgi:hypothetical protein
MLINSKSLPPFNAGYRFLDIDDPKFNDDGKEN